MFVEESLWRSMREGFTVFRSKCSPNVVDFGLVFYQFGETIHFASRPLILNMKCTFLMAEEGQEHFPRI